MPVPSGTGKSHRVEAIAHQVIDAGTRVAWFTLESVTATVGRAAVDGTVRQHGDQLSTHRGNDLDRRQPSRTC